MILKQIYSQYAKFYQNRPNFIEDIIENNLVFFSAGNSVVCLPATCVGYQTF